MLRYFRRITARAQELGNHRRKYLNAIDKWGRLLIDRLEELGRFDLVHIRHPAYDVGQEMDIVIEAGHDETEKLNLLGCYYAIQFLHMNIRAIDHLRLQASDSEDRIGVYAEFLRRAAEDFEILIQTYMQRLLDLFLADGPRPEFVVCTVGTRLHQDDVDLGIIDDGSPARIALNQAIGRMGREMVRWASVPDFYLTDHIGGSGYTVSIEEYRERLDSRILDLVSVSEILSAQPVVGSHRLFERFKRELHRRYNKQRKPSREHEGYLRGIVGEIDSLLRWPHAPNMIIPKDQLLRPVIGVVCAFRTLHRIHEPELWGAMEAIQRRVRKHRQQFTTLARCYTFVETFRHLYQQFAAQEEEVDLSDPDQEVCLQQIAEAMGYTNIGVVPAWQHLIVHYFEFVRDGQQVVRELRTILCDHIREITFLSRWTPLLETDIPPERRPNLATEFIRRVGFFANVTYWEDLLEALEAENSPLLERVTSDLYRLDPVHREETIHKFVVWGHQSFYATLRFLMLLHEHGRQKGSMILFKAHNRLFLEALAGNPDEIRRLATVFAISPGLLHRYLSVIDEDQKKYFHDVISRDVWDREVAVWRDRLLRLCEIHIKASRYFMRAVERLGSRNPELLRYFGELDRLARIAKGIVADVQRFPSISAQKDGLGRYYDIEFLRFCLATLQGAPLAQVDAEFTEFSDHFLEMLYEICKAEVDRDLGKRTRTHDLLALFVAGGHARERAHQDDYDLVVLVNSASDEIYDYSERIVTRLNREITRRGIMPQHRFSDRFGGFVTRFIDLEEFLWKSEENILVEMSQLLGARLIAGSSRLENAFHARIIEDCIYAQKERFIRSVIDEIVSRHRDMAPMDQELSCDIKECRGGLRDLEITMLLWKAMAEIREPIGGQFWDILAEAMPTRQKEFMILKDAYEFLNRLRDLYRLSVAPVNEIDFTQLDRPAKLLGYEAENGRSAGERVAEALQRHRQQVARRLDDLIAELNKTVLTG